MIVRALVVERGRCRCSRCYGDSNGGLHVVASGTETTRARDRLWNQGEDRELSALISLRPSQSSYAMMAGPRNVFWCRRRDLHIEAAPRAGQIHAIGIRARIDASEIGR